jgi:ketosteroid isomerase-like protein
MSNIDTVNELYAAYRRADLPAILAMLTDDVRWETEGPSEISFVGIRNGVKEATGFFEGLAKDWSDPHLETSRFISSGDEVAVFGRYEATNRKPASG